MSRRWDKTKRILGWATIWAIISVPIAFLLVIVLIFAMAFNVVPDPGKSLRERSNVSALPHDTSYVTLTHHYDQSQWPSNFWSVLTFYSEKNRELGTYYFGDARGQYPIQRSNGEIVFADESSIRVLNESGITEITEGYDFDPSHMSPFDYSFALGEYSVFIGAGKYRQERGESFRDTSYTRVTVLDSKNVVHQLDVPGSPGGYGFCHGELLLHTSALKHGEPGDIDRFTRFSKDLSGLETVLKESNRNSSASTIIPMQCAAPQSERVFYSSFVSGGEDPIVRSTIQIRMFLQTVYLLISLKGRRSSTLIQPAILIPT